MAAVTDPTLVAIDEAMERRENSREPRSYLGDSAVGHPCEAKLWHGFRGAARPRFRADVLRKFQDGHEGERLMIDRLRTVPGVALWTTDQEKGGQIGVHSNGGHNAGHVDGVIRGLLQDPENPYIWEHKQVDESNLKKLEKIIEKHGEAHALKEWNITYYGQAHRYMRGLEIPRHYMTIASAGGRRYISVTTPFDQEYSDKLQDKIDRIIASDRPLDRMNDNPGWFECKWCEAWGVCHDKQFPAITCGTCTESTAVTEGKGAGSWFCRRKNAPIIDWERGCSAHTLIPDLNPWGKAVDANEFAITYELEDGRKYMNGVDGFTSRELKAAENVDVLFDETALALRKAFDGRIADV